MTTPTAGSLAFTGYAPRLVINTRIVPGEANLRITGIKPVTEVDVRSLLTDLPYMLATFSETRRIIRQTVDEVRDVVMQGRDTEVYLVLELDGYLYAASALGVIELECSKAGTTDTVSINSTDNPEVFDISRRVVMRGQAVNALVIKLTAATVASFFTEGIWSIDVFGTDTDHPTGAHWGTIEFEVRSLFEGVFITPLTGGLTLTTTTPRVVYRNIRPDTAELILTGNAPTLGQSTRITPTVGAISYSGNAPTTPGRITPPTGAIVLTGVAPVRTP